MADEGVEYPVVERLREDGHEVAYVAEMEPGISDDEVLDSANRDGALLFTADRDSGELVFRQRRLHSGVIVPGVVEPEPPDPKPSKPVPPEDPLKA